MPLPTLRRSQSLKMRIFGTLRCRNVWAVVDGESVLSSRGDTAITAQGFKIFLFSSIHLTQTILCTPVVPVVPKLSGMFPLRTDQAQNLPLAKQTEKITAKEIARRTMSLTQWTQVLTRMLQGVAGLSA
uniref:Uncharacterized protein n=1 Tax=Arundo donax TaxID=35708 RepID=A0A0A9CK23_ARUDO